MIFDSLVTFEDEYFYHPSKAGFTCFYGKYLSPPFLKQCQQLWHHLKAAVSVDALNCFSSGHGAECVCSVPEERVAVGSSVELDLRLLWAGFHCLVLNI